MKRREISKSVGEIEEGGKIRDRERGIFERNRTVHIDILLHHVILYYIILYYIILYYIILYNFMSNYLAFLFYNILHHIISHYLMLYDITLNYNVTPV